MSTMNAPLPSIDEAPDTGPQTDTTDRTPQTPEDPLILDTTTAEKDES